MSDFFRAALGLFAVIAPFGALPVFLAWAAFRPTVRTDGPSGPSDRGGAGTPTHGAQSTAFTGSSKVQTWPDAVPACTAAFAVLVLAIVIADPALDFLDISPETFQFAAGVAMAPLALRLLLTGDSAPPPGEPATGLLPPWLVPLAAPLLASPPAIIAAMSYSARFGEGTALAAAAAVVLTTALIVAGGPFLARVLGRLGIGVLGRLSGGLLIVVAVELIVDGVQSV